MTKTERELRDALAWFAATLAGPSDSYPEITPEVWRSMRCRDGLECQCDICRWESRYQPELHWRQVNRPRLRSELPTIDHLLVSWAERTYYRSAAGSLMARANDEAPPPNRSNEPWAVRRAEVALEVERSVRWAYSDPKHCHGFTTDQCIAILLASVRGTATDVDDLATKVIRSGRRWTLIDLAARGLVRMPKGSRDLIAVSDRIEQLSKPPTRWTRPETDEIEA